MVSPIVGQAIFSLPPTSLEILIPNQLDYQTNQQKLLLDVRGGGSDLSEFIIRLLLIWTMSQNSKPTKKGISTKANKSSTLWTSRARTTEPTNCPKITRKPS